MLEIKDVSCGYDGVDVIKKVSFKIEKGKNL